MTFIDTLKQLLAHPLNSTNRFDALLRFAKWQIGSRIVPGDVIFNWVSNAKIIARTGETGVTGNIYCGLHEFQDMAFLLHVLRKQDLFVDIGANVGSYTILAGAAIGARVQCFEPVPSTYSKLMANIRINDMTERTSALNVALGVAESEIHFSSNQNCMNHVIAQGEQVENPIAVKITTLDSVLKDNPFLIKIDVEGYETPALEGAENTLRNKELCAVIMELNGSGKRYGFDEAIILQRMFDYGFQTFSYNPFDRTLTSLEGKHLSSGNTLFIRNIDRVLERVSSAPHIQIHGLSF